jgi:DNA-binding transcriptional regulator YiaG
MAVAENTYANFSISEMQNLAVSGMRAHQSAVHRTCHRPSTSEVFDHISRYRSGQPQFWTYTKKGLDDILVKLCTADSDKNSPQQEVLIKRLSELKSSIGLADEELAKILKISRKTLHNWQHGSTIPNKTKLLRLVAQHNILRTWLSNGYPEISKLNFEVKEQILSKLQKDNVDVDDLLYFGSGLMLTADFDVIDDPFA